jgi:replication factor C subunit 1
LHKYIYFKCSVFKKVKWYRYNSQHHDTIFHDGGAAIKKSTSGPKEDLVGTIVAEEEPEAPEEEKVDELEELKKSKDLKVVTRKKGDAVTKKRKATSAAGSSSKKKTKK